MRRLKFPSFRPWRERSLSALDSEVDLHPLLVLLKNAVILAQRKTLPAVGHQNALQVRMSVELNTEHVEDLALQPVRSLPNRYAGRNRSAVRDLRFHPHALVARKRIENPYHVELPFALRIMHRGNVNTVIESLLIPQQAQDVGDQSAVDRQVVLPKIGKSLQRRTDLTSAFFTQRRSPRHRHRPTRLGRSSRLGRGRCWRDRRLAHPARRWRRLALDLRQSGRGRGRFRCRLSCSRFLLAFRLGWSGRFYFFSHA